MPGVELVNGTEIRGLTLWRPWPWAFTHADKRVENRTWATPRWLLGKYLALHAGKKWDQPSVDQMLAGEFGHAARAISPLPADHPHSVIVAVVQVTGCYEPGPGLGTRDPWAFGPFCWITPYVRTLPEPVPCKGARGLWTLPQHVFENVRDQLARLP